MKKEIKVATYNITGAINSTNRFYSTRGNDKCQKRINIARDNLEKIANWVEEQNISILTLQEVDVCSNGKEKLNQAEFLSYRLSMNHRYVVHSDYSLPGGKKVTTGLALFSKYEIIDSKVIEFDQSHLPLVERLKKLYVGSKKALHSLVNVEGQGLNIVSAHLTHNNDNQKEHELEEILQICEQEIPSLLMGDLNTTPMQTRNKLPTEDWFYETDGAMSILANHRDNFQYDQRLGDFITLPKDFREIMTSPSEKPNKKVDYLFLFPGFTSLVISEEEVGKINVSDHRPVIASLKLE